MALKEWNVQVINYDMLKRGLGRISSWSNSGKKGDDPGHYIGNNFSDCKDLGGYGIKHLSGFNFSNARFCHSKLKNHFWNYCMKIMRAQL